MDLSMMTAAQRVGTCARGGAKYFVLVRTDRTLEFMCSVCMAVKRHARGWAEVWRGGQRVMLVCESCLEAGAATTRERWLDEAKRLREKGSDARAAELEREASQLPDDDGWWFLEEEAASRH